MFDLSFGRCFGQGQQFKVLKKGDTVPNISFNIQNGGQIKHVSLKDFKGRLLILDYWDISCADCVANMPKILKLQQQFKNEIEIIEVSEDKESDFKDFLEKSKLYESPSIRQAAQQLDFITDDTIISKMFPHHGFGCSVWITQNQLFASKSWNAILTANNISLFLKGKKIDFQEQPAYSSIDLSKPFLSINGSKGTDSSYYSLITKRNWFGGIYGDREVIIDSATNLAHGIVCTNKSILDLYREVCHGIYKVELNKIPSSYLDSKIILAVKNRNRFIDTDKMNFAGYDSWIEENTYCYALNVPIDKSPIIYRKMTEDLNDYFGLNIEQQNRFIKCLVLKRITKRDMIRTKGGQYRYTILYDSGNDTIGKLVYQNVEFSHFFSQSIEYTVTEGALKGISNYLTLKPLVIDETGYKNNVDIQLPNWRHGITLNYMNKDLQKIGLRLFEEYKKMPVIVIEDSPKYHQKTSKLD